MFCSIFRLMISHAADGDGRLSGTTEKHIRHCASCREFYKTCLSLGEGLTREAAISNEEISERLSNRILTAMHHRRTEAYKVGVKLWPTVAAACVGLIVLTGALLLLRQPEKQQPNQYEQAAKVIRDIVVSADNLAGGSLVKEQFPAGWPGLIQEPLANELNNLADDTESALRFLVACVAVDISGTEGKSVN